MIMVMRICVISTLKNKSTYNVTIYFVFSNFNFLTCISSEAWNVINNLLVWIFKTVFHMFKFGSDPQRITTTTKAAVCDVRSYALQPFTVMWMASPRLCSRRPWLLMACGTQTKFMLSVYCPKTTFLVFSFFFFKLKSGQLKWFALNSVATKSW